MCQDNFDLNGYKRKELIVDYRKLQEGEHS
jgi:hypothetical protein